MFPSSFSMFSCSFCEISVTANSGVACRTTSGGRVASGTVAQSDGIKAGLRGVAVGVGEAVRVAVAVGVAVGGKTICVAKLHANKDKIKKPKTIRFIFIITYTCHCEWLY